MCYKINIVQVCNKEDIFLNFYYIYLYLIKKIKLIYIYLIKNLNLRYFIVIDFEILNYEQIFYIYLMILILDQIINRIIIYFLLLKINEVFMIES